MVGADRDATETDNGKSGLEAIAHPGSVVPCVGRGKTTLLQCFPVAWLCPQTTLFLERIRSFLIRARIGRVFSLAFELALFRRALQRSSRTTTTAVPARARAGRVAVAVAALQ